MREKENLVGVWSYQLGWRKICLVYCIRTVGDTD